MMLCSSALRIAATGRDRLHRATGRTLHRPTLAERISRAGGTAIAISNVSPGAAYFLDPDGFGWVYNPAGSFSPGRRHARSSLIDIAPTVLQHLGLSATGMDGQTLPHHPTGTGWPRLRRRL